MTTPPATSIAVAILASGSLCAVLDGVSAGILWAARKIPSRRGWQAVASAAIGPKSFEGGGKTAALGLLFHVIVAFSAATAFVLAASEVPWLLQNPVLVGMLYGVAVFAFMNLVVIPASRMTKRPFSFAMSVAQLLIHIFVVGLSISLPAAHFLRY